jgi:hypothetical protein
MVKFAGGTPSRRATVKEHAIRRTNPREGVPKSRNRLSSGVRKYLRLEFFRNGYGRSRGRIQKYGFEFG